MTQAPHTARTMTRRRQWLTLAAVAVGVFITAIDNSIVNVALPSIQRDLDLGLTGIAWVVNGYILSFAVLLLTGGRLADSFGRRRVFLLGLAGFTGASLLAGLASSAGMLIGARVLRRRSGAADAADPGNHQPHLPRAAGAGHGIGIWGAVAALAFAIGPVLGGLITDHLHWSWIFFVNVPVGLAGSRRCAPDSRVRRGRRPRSEEEIDRPAPGSRRS